MSSAQYFLKARPEVKRQLKPLASNHALWRWRLAHRLIVY